MAYLVAKLLIVFLILGNIVALQTHDQTQLPTDNFGNYTNKNCCPTGYYPAG
jgi:hypothetical protein